jgi:hypothetical protein
MEREDDLESFNSVSCGLLRAISTGRLSRRVRAQKYSIIAPVFGRIRALRLLERVAVNQMRIGMTTYR